MSPPGDRREPPADTKCPPAAQRKQAKRACIRIKLYICLKLNNFIMESDRRKLSMGKYSLFILALIN